MHSDDAAGKGATPAFIKTAQHALMQLRCYRLARTGVQIDLVDRRKGVDRPGVPWLTGDVIAAFSQTDDISL